MLPLISSAYTVLQQVGGTIPDCLYTLPKLTQLQLSANQFAGELPKVLTPSIHTLILANNQLRGTIPAAIWDAPNISYLDLSFNKLRDEFPSTPFARRLSHRNASVALYLQNNRLSGDVSSNIQSLSSINVLEGNLIHCNVDRHDLPSNDPNAQMYECDSNSANVSLIVWTVVHKKSDDDKDKRANDDSLTSTSVEIVRRFRTGIVFLNPKVFAFMDKESHEEIYTSQGKAKVNCSPLSPNHESFRFTTIG
jgi:hypothetical protein